MRPRSANRSHSDSSRSECLRTGVTLLHWTRFQFIIGLLDIGSNNVEVFQIPSYGGQSGFGTCQDIIGFKAIRILQNIV